MWARQGSPEVTSEASLPLTGLPADAIHGPLFASDHGSILASAEAAVGEYGWDGSAGTFFAVDPTNETVVILMTQNLPASPDGLRQRFKAAVWQAIVN